VDGQDFIIWNAHKFVVTPVIPGWCQGHFNADAAVDGADFDIWYEYKFQSSGTQSPALTSVLSSHVGDSVHDQDDAICIPVTDSNATILPQPRLRQATPLFRVDRAFAAWSGRDRVHSGETQEQSLNDDSDDESLINSWVF